jgi:hypothetical protein
VTPHTFKPFTRIGFDHHQQTGACQTFRTKPIVQIIGNRARGKLSNVNAFGRRIDDRLDIE